MDLGGAAPRGVVPTVGAGGNGSPLERLASETRREFTNLLRARSRTEVGLGDRRERLGRLDHDSDASVVLMGSWGRAEATSGSDDDFMVLVDGPPAELEAGLLALLFETATLPKVVRDYAIF